MSETTVTSGGTTAAANPPTPVMTNWIMYRTVALMSQPGCTYLATDKPVLPEPVVLSPQGTVVSVISMVSDRGMTAPNGYAYAQDTAGKYPAGSVYTPPED
ncbi:hypothetical protein [Asaia lannensis]|uniref:hypothetical protein n=1 Tax=Asaia lannensis TaxID=415421 RepID=UPI00387329EC